MPLSLEERLSKLGIRYVDELIYEMEKPALLQHFGKRAANGKTSLNISLSIKNLIWQDYQFILAGELPLFEGNIRSYWYMRVKPMLARAIRNFNKQYDTMIKQFVGLVLDHRLFDYQHFGFTDENESHRRVDPGENGYIFLVAEKVGHYKLLQRIADHYGVTIVALGGQPSVLSSEYLTKQLQDSGFDLNRPAPCFTIVDYDPSGDSIALNFIEHIQTFGYKGELKRIDLAHPKHMTAEQIKLNLFKLSKKKRVRKKNSAWVKKTGSLKNYGHKGKWLALEADAMTWPQFTEVFGQQVLPYLKVPVELLQRRRSWSELQTALMKYYWRRLGITPP